MAIVPSASAGAPPERWRDGTARFASADRALGWAVIVSIVSLAFNDLPSLLPIGEMSQDAFVYAVPLLALFLLRSTGEIEIPSVVLFFAAAFAINVLAGVVVNYHEIVGFQLKGRSGLERVFTQSMTFGLGVFITVLAYNLARHGMTAYIVKGAKVALFIMAGVGVLECASWMELPGLTQLHEMLALAIHNSGSTYSTRLRMTAFEVSWAGVMLAFFFPFGVVSMGGFKKSTVFYAVLVAILVFLAQSRTAMLVFAFQILLLAWFYGRNRLDLVIGALTAAAIGAHLLATEPTVYQNVAEAITDMAQGQTAEPDQEENLSNVTRAAAIRSAMSMFSERPLLGVGFGQYGFHYAQHLQADDFRSYEVWNYVTDDSETPWPPTYSMHARLLAETGFPGYLIWLGFILWLLGRSFRNMIKSGPDSAPQHLAVVMTLCGLLILGVSIDSFRFFGGWIAMGLALGLPEGRSVRSSGPALHIEPGHKGNPVAVQ